MSKKTTLHTIRANKGKDLSPIWDGWDSWSLPRFTKNYHDAMHFYNLEISNKDIKPTVIRWMQLSKIDSVIIDKFKKSEDWRCVSSLSSIASCLMRGMPPSRPDFNKGRDAKEWLTNQIDKIIKDSEANDSREDEFSSVAPIKKPSVNIQERVRDISLAMCDDIELFIDKFITNPEKWDHKGLKVLNLFKSKEVKAAHAKIIQDFYAPSKREIESLFGDDVDDDLKENYSCYTKKQLRNLLEFYREIDSVCSMIVAQTKVAKVKKPIAKDKLVEKLKYKKSDDNLKVVSIPPTTIIGANILWLFDTKTRKLYQYVANDNGALSVEGSRIVGYDENKSIGKTLKKPLEELNKFQNAGKVLLRSFMDNIQTLEIRGTGKVTEHQLLLKVQT